MKKSELVSMIKEEMKVLSLPAQKVEEPKEPLKTLKQIKDWENKNPALPDEKTSVKQIDAIDESFGRLIVRESLTKKDFISMVGYIKQAPQQHRSALIDFAVKISTADNPRFDEKKFRAACGSVTEAKHASDGVALYHKQDGDTKKPVKEADNDREKHLIYQRGMEMYFDQNGNFTSAYSEERGNKVSPLPADIAAAKEKLKKQMTNENFMSNPTPQGQNVKQEQPEPKPLLPVKKAEFHKLIGQYNEYGKVLKRSGSLREMARKLGALATLAERTVVSEADDWFDAHTVKRNMKELKSYAGEFGKYAVEADQVMERVTALYDDMGRVLERYFEIYDISEAAQIGEAKYPKDVSDVSVKAANLLSKKALVQAANNAKKLNEPIKSKSKTEDCGVKKYTEPQDSFDVDESNNPEFPNETEVEHWRRDITDLRMQKLQEPERSAEIDGYIKRSQEKLTKALGKALFAKNKSTTEASSPSQKPCSYCNGTGHVRVKADKLQDMKVSAQCGRCKGTGKIGSASKLLAPKKDSQNAGSYWQKHYEKNESITPMSARAINLVYKQLNEQNKAKLRTLPVSRMAEICWKLLK